MPRRTRRQRRESELSPIGSWNGVPSGEKRPASATDVAEEFGHLAGDIRQMAQEVRAARSKVEVLEAEAQLPRRIAALLGAKGGSLVLHHAPPENGAEVWSVLGLSAGGKAVRAVGESMEEALDAALRRAGV